MGLGETLADDAEWIDMTYHDRKLNRVINRGKLAISISIVPEVESINRPVGTGQDAPNVNPYLPPPFGRFTFTFNPFSLINQLCGPKILCLIICIYCCLCCLGTFWVLSSYLSGIESIIQMFTQMENSIKYDEKHPL